MTRASDSLFDVVLDRDEFRLDFQLESSADSLVLFGPSGSGKTTLLRVLLGLEPQSRARIRLGEVWLDDSTAGLSVPVHERRLGWVPQSPLLFPDRSVLANIQFGARGRGDHPEIGRAIEVLELKPHLSSRTHELSGGERQRVALARALASQPRALLLDEPLASLDLTLRSRVLPYLLRIREELDLPLIHITHDPDEAILLGDEIAVIDSGRLVAHGDPRKTLWSRAVLPLTTLLGVENLIQAEGASGGSASTRVQTRGGLELETPWPVDAGEPIRLGLRAEDVLIGLDRPGRLSARNVCPGRIERIEGVGEDRMIHVDVAGERIVAKLTGRAVAELELATGHQVYLIIKSQALRRI